MTNESTGVDEEVTSEVETSTEELADNSLSVIEYRIAALEQAQRQSVLEIRSAVGRVQSIASKLDKANDPQVEAKLRTELAGVSDLLGLVTGSIDESILPRDVKQRVADAQSAIRKAAADAEVDRRIAIATARPDSMPAGIDANNIEAQVVSQIRSMGLDDTDPAFNWTTAAAILNTQGEQAMWAYFGGVERQLMAGGADTEGGPQRRTRAAPRATPSEATKTGVDKFLDPNTPLAEKLAEMRAQGL